MMNGKNALVTVTVDFWDVLRASDTRPRRVRGVVLAWAHTPGVSWASPKLQMWVRDSIPPTVTP